MARYSFGAGILKVGQALGRPLFTVACDAAVLGGAAAIVHGIAMFSVAAAWIAGGVFAIGLGLAGSYAARGPGPGG